MTGDPEARFRKHHVQEIIQQNRHSDAQWVLTKRLLGEVRVLKGLVHSTDFEQQQIRARNKENKRAGCKQAERKNQND